MCLPSFLAVRHAWRIARRLFEGINGLVQTSKRKVRSYKNVRNLIAMVYMTANKLRLPALAARRSWIRLYPSNREKGQFF